MIIRSFPGGKVELTSVAKEKIIIFGVLIFPMYFKEAQVQSFYSQEKQQKLHTLEVKTTFLWSKIILFQVRTFMLIEQSWDPCKCCESY